MPFGPVAIVGRGCLLPGAATPEALWDAVVEGRDLLGTVPPGRWRLDPDFALAPTPAAARDRTWSDRGGYVEGFRFDADGFLVPASELAGLDPLFSWVLHVTRAALLDARLTPGAPALARAGLVLGNLSFPSEGLSRLAEATWFPREVHGLERPDARNRFMSGLPAHLAARALGLGAPAFALDAACASSLYAITLACHALHDHRADVMLAGAVNRADDLFIHVGFSALQALSRTGRSRPFHRDADGLLPAEGAACFVLKRLEDAEAAGDAIHGVIRGVGLANDGRGAGLLSPSEEGQVRALRRAYAAAGLSPSEVALLECHATGTAVGDATEVRSTGAVFEGRRDVPVGSVKGNLGHLITAAGAAGLLKVLGAFRHGVLPPSRHEGPTLAALQGSPFRLLTAAEPWTGPRRAGVSAFGFGGNNAHLIVEAWTAPSASVAVPVTPPPAAPVAIVAVAVRAAGARSTHDVVRLLAGLGASGADVVELDAAGLRFPPKDLAQALPQQLALLEVAREAVAEAGALPRETTAVLVGMQCDAEVARYGARWRVAQWARQAGAPAEAVDAARDAIVPPLDAAGVLGTMPNLCANRLNSQFDLGGPSFTVSAEELSGVRALEVAVRGLAAREIDAAVVCAVDLCREPVQAAAAAETLPVERRTPGDAAVALVLRRLADAERDGQRVHAVLPDALPPAGETAPRLPGHAHAASGLLQVALATLATSHGLRPGPDGAQPALAPPEDRTTAVHVRALGGQEAVVALRGGAHPPRRPLRPVTVSVYGASDRGRLAEAVARDERDGTGHARVAVVAQDEAERRARREAVASALREGTPLPAGTAFREAALSGELALVFAAPGGAYRGMGQDLLLACPDLGEAVAARFPRLVEAGAWAFGTDEPRPVDKLWGASLLSQVHAELSLRSLRLRPQAAIGFCSGETNALFALGAWDDLEGLHHDIEEAQVYERALAGTFDVVRAAWGVDHPVRWGSWRVLAPHERVVAALAGEPRVHLTIANAPGDYVLAGEAEAGERVLARIGRERARPLGYDMAVHCPEMAAFAPTWRRLHTRPTRAVPGVRFYTHATLSSYTPTTESVAEALTRQAGQTVDFPALVQRAWDDGVRVFVEHGPQGACTRWISKVLGEREHLAVALDAAGEDSLLQAATAVAQLAAAGVPLDLGPFAPRPAAAATPGARLRFALHAAPPAVPELGERVQVMAPAPVLPPVLDAVEDEPDAAAISAPGPTPTLAEARVAARPAAVPDRAPSPAPAVHAAVGAPAAVHALLEQFGRVVDVHHGYLETQSTLHQRFLALRAGGATPPRTARRAAVEEPPAARPPDEPPPPGPSRRTFARADLEVHASGRISQIFGPAFAGQDAFTRQVRMPEPPLLLADRVVGLTGEPGSMGRGTVQTETDVTEDAWYLHERRMPAGILIESGQADLFLISWLGVDALNRGERVYRLLGCDLTYHGSLPVPGETLAYDIHVDGHARQGEVRLFFFHYDCVNGGRPQLTVRNGQAGFFADEELAATGGVLWDAETGEHEEDARVDRGPRPTSRSTFDEDAVRAFSEGRAEACFGPGFERAETHVQPPRIQDGRMRLFDRVTRLDPAGGPWGRGYLKAVRTLRPDDWFFAGHFKDDPCMPGTLMFEGCLQAMAFYLAGLGFTLERDGWRFEPVPEETYRLRCRGQATPASRELVYEVFVDALHDGPEPTLYADLLCTVDGVKAFHCRRMGLRLVPDWPLTRRPGLLRPPGPGAEVLGVRQDERAILACAWGRPSEAFGEGYRPFDGGRRMPRLPGPPYLFLSRVTRFDGEPGVARPRARIAVEYDVPREAWFFDAWAEEALAIGAEPRPTMPFAVFLEALLQPCGWLALATGIPAQTAEPLHFRNLDGTLTWWREVTPGCGTLALEVGLTSVSRSGSTWLVGFEVTATLAGQRVAALTTAFGFFPAEALGRQVGLPATDDDRARVASAGNRSLDLRSGRADRDRRPGLDILDRLTWREVRDGRTTVRAEKDIDPSEWFLKAHFFQDPVQPGSLGLEAMLQLLRRTLAEERVAEGLMRPQLEPLVLGQSVSWKYRGQVLPESRRVTVEADLTRLDRTGPRRLVLADASLWVDGTRIYSATGIGTGVVEG